MEEEKNGQEQVPPIETEHTENTEGVDTKPETVEELKQRLHNAQKENERKTLELQMAREQAEKANETRAHTQQVFNVNDLNTWKDHELKSVQKDPQYAHLADQAEDILFNRRQQRFQREQRDAELRTKAELERQKIYPDSMNPASPLAIRMQELIYQYRLDNSPASKLVAAKLAASEIAQAKAALAGRKQEQNRQSDVTGNFSGGSRPSPVKVDAVKFKELKERAMAGDPVARAEWYKLRGLI